MQRTCRKLGLEGLSLHSFRHTFGTRLGEAGASAHVVKQLMGHSSITVSQRYVHKLTESVERAMAAMEEATRKVGTIPGQVPAQDAGWLPPNSCCQRITAPFGHVRHGNTNPVPDVHARRQLTTRGIVRKIHNA